MPKETPKLEILVGMIASGKTTYCRKRARDGALIVGSDEITAMLHGGDYTGYDPALKPVYRHIEAAAIVAGLREGRDVIVDRTGLRRDHRARYVTLANLENVEAHAMLFPRVTPEKHAERRHRHDPRGYSLQKWLSVAYEHAATYQPVERDEGFAEIHHIEGPKKKRKR